MSRATILLIGMHRSGTSVLSKLVNALGVHIGRQEELLAHDPVINPTGYWERLDIVTTHEKFLVDHGFHWARIANFELARIDTEARGGLAMRLAEICRRIDSGGRPLLIKDPRICLLLPVWHAIIPAPVHIVAVRDPRKIATSLIRAFPSVFTTQSALAFWQKHMQQALAALAGKSAIFVEYEALLRAPQTCMHRLRTALINTGVDDLLHLQPAQIDSILNQQLDRSGISPASGLSEDQASLYLWLQQQCAAPSGVSVDDVPQCDGADAVLQELDRLREECARLGYAAGKESMRDQSRLRG